MKGLMRSFLLGVALPTLVGAVYFGLLASDVFVSETRFAIRTSDDSAASGLLATMLGPQGSGASGDDSYIVRDYILSRDMLRLLEASLSLRAHYSADGVAAFSRLGMDASDEKFLDYFRAMVDVTVDGDITTLKVRGFDADTAQSLAQEILRNSEELVNQLSERITTDTLKFARKEVDLAELKVKAASSRVTAFRKERQSIDPGEETTAVLGIVTELESVLAAERAELVQAQTFMRADSAKVTNLKARVAALEAQVKRERLRLASESGTDLTRLIDGYQPLVLDQKLAEQRYTSALTSLEVARAEAQRKQRYLIAFVVPEVPDEAIEPDRALKILTIFVGAAFLYGIGGLIVAAVKDHAGL